MTYINKLTNDEFQRIAMQILDLPKYRILNSCRMLNETPEWKSLLTRLDQEIQDQLFEGTEVDKIEISRGYSLENQYRIYMDVYNKETISDLKNICYEIQSFIYEDIRLVDITIYYSKDSTFIIEFKSGDVQDIRINQIELSKFQASLVIERNYSHPDIPYQCVAYMVPSVQNHFYDWMKYHESKYYKQFGLYPDKIPSRVVDSATLSLKVRLYLKTMFKPDIFQNVKDIDVVNVNPTLTHDKESYDFVIITVKPIYYDKDEDRSANPYLSERYFDPKVNQFHVKLDNQMIQYILNVSEYNGPKIVKPSHPVPNPIYVWNDSMTPEQEANGAYWERNMLALFFATTLNFSGSEQTHGWYYHIDEPYLGYARVISLFDGEITFHVPDNFDMGGLKQIEPNWNGTTTREKWERILDLCGCRIPK